MQSEIRLYYIIISEIMTILSHTPKQFCSIIANVPFNQSGGFMFREVARKKQIIPREELNTRLAMTDRERSCLRLCRNGLREK